MIKINDVQYLRAFLFFFHSSAIIIVSFLPLYLEKIGLSGTEIGLLLAIGPLATIISQPILGYLSDKYKTVKKIIILLLIGVILATPMLFLTTNIYMLMLIMFLFFSFFSPIGSLGDSLAQRMSFKDGITFGSIRTWGSIGFAITGIISGYILSFIGLENIIYPYLFYTFIALIVVLKITDVKDESSSIKISDTKKIFANKEFMVFLVLMLFVTVTHRASDSFLGIFIYSKGGDESLVGWAWFIAVISEAIIFATSRYWLFLFNELTLIAIAAFLYGVRWYLFSTIQTGLGILLVQGFHGLTFGVFYLTGFQLITNLLPKHLYTTGHLLYTAFFFGLSGIIGSLAGGIIIEYTDTSTLYFYLSISAFLGSFLLFLYRYFHH